MPMYTVLPYAYVPMYTVLPYAYVPMYTVLPYVHSATVLCDITVDIVKVEPYFLVCFW